MPDGFTLAEKGPLYALASRLIVAEVDADLWSTLSQPPLPELLNTIDAELGSLLEQPLGESRVEALAVEYARLFLLPGGVTPYASQWLADKDHQDAAREEIIALATQVMTVLELVPDDSGLGGRLPLEHVGLLFEIAARAAQTTDAQTRTALGPLEMQLFGQAWQGFGQALAHATSEPLYRALGRLIYRMHG